MLVAFALAWTSGPQLLAAELPRLRPDGGYLVDESGQKVPLKGCNLGTWLLIEPWMLGVSSQYEDQCSFLAKLQSRFGNDCAGQLMNVYRDNWIGRREVELIRSFGFNLVRLPFHYSLLTDDAKPLVLRRDAFAWLDRAVNLAEESGLYIILDMHGVPGGQSIDMPTGCRGINALWSDPANQQRTAWLWQQIAARYRTRAAVVAYDIINEPYGDFRSDIRPQLLDIVNQVHTSIRQVDPDKLIFAPSPIHGIEFYGEPRGHGWTNVGFTEHFYPGIFDGVAPTLETHGRFLATTVGAKRLYVEGLAVPYLVGEFNVVYDRLARPEWMRRYYDEYAAAGWLATMWSARLISTQGGLQPDHWYLMTNVQPFTLPDLNTASREDVEQAFRELGSMDLVVDEALRAALTAPAGGSFPFEDYADLKPTTVPADAIPGWVGVDVAGAAPAGGQKSLAGGGLTLYGGGSDIWSNRDAFRYLYKTVNGDFTVQNWLTSLRTTHQYAKVGWMVRESLDADAAHLFIHAFPNGRVAMCWRATRGGQTTETTLEVTSLPVGLGLERTGSTTVVRYTDADGVWQQATAAGVQLPTKALVGLVVLSHESNLLASATFDSVTCSSPCLAPALPTNRLQNGSFEIPQGSTVPDQAKYWNRWGEWLNREQGWTPSRDGDCMLGYRHWQIQSAANSGAWQDVTSLTPGMRQTFSVDANRDLPAGGKFGPDSVELRIESQYQGRWLFVASQTFGAGDIATGAGWSRLHVAGLVPADNARVLIIVNPSSQTPRDASFKFDNASLRTQPTLAAPAQLSSEHVLVGGEK